MRLIMLVAAFALLSSATASAKPTCNWGRWHVSPGGTGVMHVNIITGKPCPLTRDLRSLGTSHMTHPVQIASKPSNGVATVSGYIVTYRSRPGYLGQDSFVFLIKGSHNNVAYTSTMRVELVVRDKL